MGLHHVTVSHHFCDTVKYRVCKVRVDIDTDNFGSFIEVLDVFYALVRRFLENSIIN